MSSPTQTEPGNIRNSLVRNVLFNWLGYGAFVVSGFVLPRLIGDIAGKDVLGLWDLGWSLAAYVMFLSLDIGSAVNRYVARYRAAGDWVNLNRAVNSCLVLLCACGLVAAVAAVGISIAVPRLVPTVSGPMLAEMRVAVLLLGMNAAVQLPASVLVGIISGCERFDFKNIARASVRCIELVGMVTALLLGGRLIALASIVLGATILRESVNYWGVRRMCPEFQLAPGLATWRVARQMVGFAGKSALQSISRSALYHSSGVLVAFFLGPVALAVYARQRALVIHVSRFLNQYAHVLIPRSSLLDASGGKQENRALFIRATRYGLYVALPAVAALAILGGPLVRVWMGPGYAAPAVLSVLALGHLIPYALRPAFCILTGMHRHGAAAVGECVSFAVGVVLTVLFVGVWGWGLVGAALALVLPLSLVSSGFLAVSAIRTFRISPTEFAMQVVVGPVAAVVPFVLCLLGAARVFPERPLASLSLGLGASGVVLAVVYWIYVLPAEWKALIRRRFFREAMAGVTES